MPNATISRKQQGPQIDEVEVPVGDWGGFSMAHSQILFYL